MTEIPEPLHVSFEQENVVFRLAKYRGAIRKGPYYAEPMILQLVEGASSNARARKILGLDGGPRTRPKKSGRTSEQILNERPELGIAARQLFLDVTSLWPGKTVNRVNEFTDELVSILLDQFPGIDGDDLAQWLESVLLIGSATDPAPDSAVLPVRLPTRELFLIFSGLTDQSLAALERELGLVGRAESIMVSAFLVAQGHELICEPNGIIAGTTHMPSGKEARGLGRIAARADGDDVLTGRAKEGDPIFRAVLSVGFLVAETPLGDQRLIRAVTVPLVTPADLIALDRGDTTSKVSTRYWISGCGLTELVDREDTSCTRQQAYAGRRLLDEWVERTGQALPIVFPAIRIKARSHRQLTSPIGPFMREMPGNICEELRALRQILGGRALIWLAETGVEEATGEALVKPDWRVRMPHGAPVPGSGPILYPDLAQLIEVYRFGTELQLCELEQPVAVGFNRNEDLVLLQAIGELDRVSGTKPVHWFIASRSLRSDPILAQRVGELVYRLHGSTRHSAALRDQRSATSAMLTTKLGGRAKIPRPWNVRELERELTSLASLMRCKKETAEQGPPHAPSTGPTKGA
jgi:hypothetical protein